ncbi:MAG: hypothetical protein ACJAVM_001835 [Sulfitobacter sp.]|jgi:hypothetical protein
MWTFINAGFFRHLCLPLQKSGTAPFLFTTSKRRAVEPLRADKVAQITDTRHAGVE